MAEHLSTASRRKFLIALATASIALIILIAYARMGQRPRLSELQPSNSDRPVIDSLPQGVFERAFALADPALSRETRAKWLGQNHSTIDHWERMMRMGRTMIGLGYDVTYDRLPYFLAGGAAHIPAPVSFPYKKEWRLVGAATARENDIPVSFLSVSYDGPFVHEMAVDAVKEFELISRGDIDPWAVRDAMKSAETRFTEIKQSESETYSWVATSSIEEAPRSLASVKGDEYAIRACIREWAPEEYTREDGASELFIYFVYLPADLAVDMTEVSRSGFSSWK